MARTYLRRADIDQWFFSEVCLGCRYLRTGRGRQQAHSVACRRRVEALLKGDSSASARLSAADERINRAVERHATKDPGMRSILKRDSVVCHPESELQRKIALDTEQDSTPQNTSTGDVRREVRTGLTQDVTRTSSSHDIGDDVVMRGDSVDESRAEHPSSAGLDH